MSNLWLILQVLWKMGPMILFVLFCIIGFLILGKNVE